MNHLDKTVPLADASHIPTTIVHDLQQALREQPQGQAHWHQLSAQDQQLLYHWIAAAPSILLWPLRIRNVVALLHGPLPVALRRLGVVTLHELCALYGHPRRLHECPSAAQEQAIGEQRVLQFYAVQVTQGTHIITRILAPQHEYRGGLLVVFARPCTFTAEIVRWLAHNPWASEAEVAAELEQCRWYHTDEALLTMAASDAQAYVNALPLEIQNMLLGRCIALRTVLLASSLVEAMGQPETAADDARDAEAQRLVLQRLEEQRHQEEQLTMLLRQMHPAQQLEFKKVAVQQALDGLLSVMKGSDRHWWVVGVTRAWLANPTNEVAQQAIRAAQFERTPGGADYYALRYHLHPIAVLEAQDALAAAREALQAVKRYALWSGKDESAAITAEEHTRGWQIEVAQAVLTMALQ